MRSAPTLILIGLACCVFWVKPLTVSAWQSQEADAPPRPRSGVLSAQKVAREQLSFTKSGGVVYCTRDSGNLKCDVYVPDGKGPYPAVLCVHGGAWRSGSKLHYIRHAWKLAERGYVVVAINYRHSPTHKFPAQVHDCKHAVRWMRKNAETYKINPEAIIGFGYSAGGHLVAMLGATQPADGLEGDVPEELAKYSSALQAVIAGGAACEFSWIGNWSLSYWLGSSKRGNPKIYEKASPINYLDHNDPPMYFFHGTADGVVPITTARKMKSRLDQLGVQTALDTVSTGHIATFNNFDCMLRGIRFVEQTLTRSKKD